MKILHTADWHIGQPFHDYERTYEHQQFLSWLIQVLKDAQIDVLLISGDVFDQSNPTITSVKMFYTFLNQAVKANPEIQIIITAGNHDSAPRLESPKPLLESSNIHIIGLVDKDDEGNIDYQKFIIPLHNSTGAVKAWCLAVPFLRMGDYPVIPNCDNPYTAGVEALYQQAYQEVLLKRQTGQPIIAMGHLHAQHAEITDLDKTERLIMGGVECISAAAFHEDICYVALGHIHKAQKIGGKEHIRYAGSPLPMSFSELHYKHQVLTFDLDAKGIRNLTSIEVPVSIPLRRIPLKHQPLHEVLPLLEQLPASDTAAPSAPYLEVRILRDGPDPALRHKIVSALNGKSVRLARIDVRDPAPTDNTPEFVSEEKLDDQQPEDVFSKVYQSKYKTPVPANMMQLFLQIVQDVHQKEN